MLIKTDNREAPIRAEKIHVKGGQIRLTERTVFGIDCELWRENDRMAHCISDMIYSTVYFREEGSLHRVSFKMQPFGWKFFSKTMIDIASVMEIAASSRGQSLKRTLEKVLEPAIINQFHGVLFDIAASTIGCVLVVSNDLSLPSEEIQYLEDDSTAYFFSGHSASGEVPVRAKDPHSKFPIWIW